MKHYSVGALKSLDDLRRLLPDGTDYTLNWLVLSTSGVHGTYGTLDGWEPPNSGDIDDTGDHITVLLIQPRMVRVWYGYISVSSEDIPWLRDQVRKSLAGIAESQKGNT